MSVRRLFVALVAISLLAAASQAAVGAQTPDTRYFPRTGQSVSGEFLRFYASVPEAEYLFGDPITAAFTDLVSGRLVQYFQKARFDYFPELPEGQRVQISKLGSALYRPGQTLNIDNPLACRQYPQSDFPICYAFLEFFDKYGGLAIFGYPISGFEIYNNRIVQHFERARFEWWPELPAGQKVSLANLGRTYFDAIREDPGRLQPAQLNGIPLQVLDLRVKAFVWQSVTRQSDVQKVYVVARDQTYRPLQNVSVRMAVTWPDGRVQVQTANTNETGIVVFDLFFQNLPFGSMVIVDVEARLEGMGTRTSTSFRAWR